MKNPNTNIQSFLTSLRAFESGTNPALTQWYITNYNQGAVIKYAKLDENGLLYQNKIIPEEGTIQKYFTKLHTARIFENEMKKLGIFDENLKVKSTALDSNQNIKPELLEQATKVVESIQYKVVNPWGFVGYQLGEAVLIDAGIYTPQDSGLKNGSGASLPKYYMWTDGTAFGPGETEKFMKWNASYDKLEVTNQANAKFVITNSNQWKGSFTGKYGINNFDDLTDPAKQEMAIREVMKFNLNVIKDIFTKNDKSLGDILNKEYPYSFKSSYTDEQIAELKAKDLNIKITLGKESYNGTLKTTEAEVTTTVKVTMSGILAMAHLTGAWGAADTLLTGIFRVDETGTSNLKYLYDFGGHNTIFGSNVNDILVGDKYSEEFTPSSGNNSIVTGEGNDSVIIENDGKGGGTTLLKDFDFNKDNIVFRNFGDIAKEKIIGEKNGNATLKVGNYELEFEGVTKDRLSINLNKITANSNFYKIGWSGKDVVENFNPQFDKIQGTSGIDFKDLRVVQDGNSVKVGSIGEDGGMHAYIELKGVSVSQISQKMFTGVTGFFSAMGQVNIEAKMTWSYWSKQTPIENFDPDTDSIGASTGGMDLSQITVKDTAEGAMICYGSQKDFGIVLAGVKASALGQNNFFGFAGKFSDGKTANNSQIITANNDTSDYFIFPDVIEQDLPDIVFNTPVKFQEEIEYIKIIKGREIVEETKPIAEEIKPAVEQNIVQNQPTNPQNNVNSNNSTINKNEVIKVEWWYNKDTVVENFNIATNSISANGWMNLSQIKVIDLGNNNAKIVLENAENGIILKGISANDIGLDNFSGFQPGGSFVRDEMSHSYVEAIESVISNSSDAVDSHTAIDSNIGKEKLPEAVENKDISSTTDNNNANIDSNKINTTTKEQDFMSIKSESNVSSSQGGKVFKLPQYKGYDSNNKLEPDYIIKFDPAKDVLELPFFAQVYKIVQTNEGLSLQDVRYSEGSQFVKVLLTGVSADQLTSLNFGGEIGNFKNITGYDKAVVDSKSINLTPSSSDSEIANDVDIDTALVAEVEGSQSGYEVAIGNLEDDNSADSIIQHDYQESQDEYQ